MELEKIIENLAIKSDVSNLSEDALIKKYTADENAYENFLRIFSRVFNGRNIYPVIVGNKYRIIEKIILQGHQYVSDGDIREEQILHEIFKNEHNPNLDLHADDFGQALYIFDSHIGANKVKNDYTSFGRKMKDMLDCALILDTEGDISKDEFCDFTKQVRRAFSPEDADIVIKGYCDDNPKMNLCYNIPYLYLANYIVRAHPSICTPEFLDFTRDVIDISTTVKDGEPEGFDYNDYVRLSKFTLDNINNLEKSRVNVDKRRGKIRDLFRKK